MRRGSVALVVAVTLALGLLGSPGPAAAASEWHSETPVAAGIDVSAPLGEVGGIAFWAPNRGVLITAGNEGMPAGIYAYDGTGWHLYSTVCGGHNGSIAWSGPNSFWTVSDYATAQEGLNNPQEAYTRTLCHFENGEVVASYAEPFGSATNYQKMKAAACNGPADCWFAGETLPPSSPNIGSFHLHWDGVSLTAVPALDESEPQIEDPPGAVTRLAFLAGTLFESATEAPYLREADLLRPQVFAPVTTPEGASGPFELGGDPGQLWAVGRSGGSALRSIGSGFEAIELERTLGEVAAIATEPNRAAAWIGGGKGGNATVTRVSATGSVSAAVTLPTPAEKLDPKGAVAAMACPGGEQCWMATEDGWLFHLGGSLPQDTDPAMHVLISSRPSDNSTRSFVPAGLPEDNSGETEPSKAIEEPGEEPFRIHPKKPALVGKIHRSIVGKRTLVLTFVLHATAHVQLLAKYHHKVVAKTPRLTLSKGPQKLRLKLDPKRWPTGLDFRVHAVGKRS